jgi:hypothetical protein
MAALLRAWAVGRRRSIVAAMVVFVPGSWWR